MIISNDGQNGTMNTATPVIMIQALWRWNELIDGMSEMKPNNNLAAVLTIPIIDINQAARVSSIPWNNNIYGVSFFHLIKIQGGPVTVSGRPHEQFIRRPVDWKWFYVKLKVVRSSSLDYTRV